MAMTDADLIALLRQRLATIEAAVEEWTTTAQETGTARRNTHAAALNYLHDYPDEIAALPTPVAQFLAIYTATLQPREEALQRLYGALRTATENDGEDDNAPDRSTTPG